ncbi:cytochrome P450 [Flagelloscypha sp. PMI_526]|nr:cytochrome P450 [Flagelloscypha sp. PMI_526]
MDLSTSLLVSIGFLLAILFSVYLIPFLWDPYRIRHIPGPFLANFSYLWLAKAALDGRKSSAVSDAHQKYGSMVRISPREISIATSEAMGDVYGHANGMTKSNFYHAFQVIPPDTAFDTTDRVRHARKRKMMSHAFSSKSLQDMEPHIHPFVEQLLAQFDLFLSSKDDTEGGEGHGWSKRGGRLWFDILPWYHFMTFDIISKLAFGSPFGMVAAGQDIAPVPTLATFDAIRKAKLEGSEWPELEFTNVPAVELIASTTEIITTLATLPPYARSWIRRSLSFFATRGEAMKNLVGLCFLMVSRRLKETTEDNEKGGLNNDLLSKLIEARDETGQPLEFSELAGESFSMVVAGSVSVFYLPAFPSSNRSLSSMGALTYYLATNPHTQAALHNELDSILGKSSSTPLVNGTVLKDLPYLEACIKEGLRLLSTVPAGLPRDVPQGGFIVNACHHRYSITMQISGVRTVKEFRPERWLEPDSKEKVEREKAFQPFSLGPRACIGRNLAMLEMGIIMGNLLHRYEFVLDEEKMKNGWGGRETLISRLGYCYVGMRQRC